MEYLYLLLVISSIFVHASSKRRGHPVPCIIGLSYYSSVSFQPQMLIGSTSLFALQARNVAAIDQYITEKFAIAKDRISQMELACISPLYFEFS